MLENRVVRSKERWCGFAHFLLFLMVTGIASAQEIKAIRYAGKMYTVATVDIEKDSLQLFLRDTTGKPFNSFSALDTWLQKGQRKLVFGMNAGMYEPDYSPVGVYVEEGRQLSPLNLKRGVGNFFLKPNGVFAVTQSGAYIVETDVYPILTQVKIATQSGPMLLIRGKINSLFRPESVSKLIRNGVGVQDSNRVVLAIAEDPVNFFEFASLFKSFLHCNDALFLDGTVSSLFSIDLHRNDQRIPLGPMFGITKRLQ